MENREKRNKKDDEYSNNNQYDSLEIHQAGSHYSE